MFSFKILSGPLRGFEMVLDIGTWYLYTYNEKNESDIICLKNHLQVADERVIFIPLDNEAPQLQLTLETHKAYINEITISENVKPLAQDIALQQRINHKGLCFTLKYHNENWRLPINEVTPLSSRPLKHYIWFAGVLLLIIAIVVSGVRIGIMTQKTDQLVVGSFSPLSSTTLIAIQQFLTSNDIAWLNIQQTSPHLISLRLLRIAGSDELVANVSLMLHQRFDGMDKIAITLHSLSEMQQALTLMLTQAGISFRLTVTPAGMHVAIIQQLSPEMLDELSYQLTEFYRRWGKRWITINIQLTSLPLAGAKLKYGQDTLNWDIKKKQFTHSTIY